MLNITKNILIGHYNKYNEQYFNCKLKIPKFYWLNCKKPYGRFIANGKNKQNEIWISKYYTEWSCDFFKEVLIHEMVHQYVYECLHGTKYKIFSHGLKFQYIKYILKRKYDINI